ncbi:MAG: GTPase [Eudoraea sp.]|nr:GTPase [Eudoraea sp.]
MDAEELEELIFVYNADSGLKNALLDGAHKVLSPATYDCNLCQLTHGAFMEKKVWRDFRERHTLPMKFLHKDEFSKEYASKFGYRFSFPLVLGTTHSGLEVVINKEELDALSDTEAFISMLEARI